MPRSRNRPGHPYQKPADIPSSQRTKGRIVWAILFGIFGMAIAFFASSQSFIALTIGGIIGGLLGYRVGKSMEKAA